MFINKYFQIERGTNIGRFSLSVRRVQTGCLQESNEQYSNMIKQQVKQIS